MRETHAQCVKLDSGDNLAAGLEKNLLLPTEMYC